jgi:hypothetical protein
MVSLSLPRASRISLVLLLLALVLGLGYILAISLGGYRVGILLRAVMRPGQGIFMATGLYFACQYACLEPGRGLGRYLLVLGLLLVSLMMCLALGDFYSAKLFVVIYAAFPIFSRGNRTLRLILPLASLFFIGFALLAAFLEWDSISVLYAWAGPAMSDLTASCAMALKLAAYTASGLWGFGPSYLSRLDLFKPDQMQVNALPYLSVLVGNIASLAFMAILLAHLLGSWWLVARSRSGSAGGWRMDLAWPVWVFIAVNQYVSFLSSVSVRGTMLAGGCHGLAFIGSPQTGLELILFALYVQSASKAQDLERERDSLAEGSKIESRSS